MKFLLVSYFQCVKPLWWLVLGICFFGSDRIGLNGFSLTITGNAKLRACTPEPFLWQGIVVSENSSLFLNQANISDAKYAVAVQETLLYPVPSGPGNFYYDGSTN